MKKLLSLLVLASFLFACDPESLNELSEEIQSTTNFTVRLTDAPVELEEVNIDLQQIMVKGPNGFSEIPLETNAGIYNLLDYQNGLDVLIAEANLEIDQIKEIRLILGDENTVVAEGETYELKVPSGSQSGLKIKLCLDLTDMPNYELILDFDACESVHKTGNGKYILKPVIKPLNPDAQCGDQDDEEEEEEDDLTVDDLPEDATTWLQENYDGYEFEVEMATLCDGSEAFQVKASKDEEELYLFFDQDGAFVQSKVEIEAGDLPEAVAMAITNDYADYNLTNKTIYRIETADASIQYHLTLRKANELLEVILDETGTEVCSSSSEDDEEEEEEEEEEDVTIDDVPEAVIGFIGENYDGYEFTVAATTFCEGTEAYLLTGQNGSNTVLLYYDLDWNLWQTGNWFKEADLSTEILGSIAADYADYKIMNNQAWELIKADESQSWYRIYIKKDNSSTKFYVVYAADGTFICSEE